MKYATYKWNVRVYIHAEAIAQRWREAGYEAEVIPY